MRSLSVLIFLLMLAYNVSAQTDTIKVVKEAPQELKNLLDNIIEQATQKVREDASLEIDGLLIEDTKTKSGREFYDLFYRDWNAPEEAKNYSIFIVEKPFRLNITLIEV